MDYKIM